MKKDGEKEPCPIEEVAKLLGDPCTLLIVRDLLIGSKRFKDFENSIESSSRTLTNKLKLLEEHQIITRTEFKEKPPRVEYALTSKGKHLGQLIEDMRVYGKKYL